MKEILRKTLKSRPSNDKSAEEKVRRSVFLNKELEILDKMLSGEYNLA